MRELQVLLFGRRAGTLTLAGQRLGFRYCAEWLAQPDAMALSLSLPLQAQPFDDHQARPFFAGLLAQVTARNDFARLAHPGSECAGAVRFLGAGQELPAAQAHAVRWLGDAEVLDLLEDRPMRGGTQTLRRALAGAPDRLPVVFDGARIGLPLGGTPSSHFLRAALPGVEHGVANAAFCTALAQVMGLRPAQTQFHAVQGRPFLLVERYDRVVDAAGRPQRLHQEDFCQALGVSPETRYQHQGGPGLAPCFDLLRRAARPARPQLLRLFDDAVFNALIGNHAAHTGSFSLLYAGKETILAPFDTFWSAAVHPALAPKMALAIGSQYDFSRLQARDWERFADGTGFSREHSRSRILELAESLPLAARRLHSAAGRVYSGNAVAERIVALITQRCALTRGLLG
ncbi:HipA domain-containing protein [Comamonas endophytica]|uniref:HipA domain-containing protein n=1 Tax=Comamonas endophytica TaxID=2949090 RepID=UPI0036165101